MRKAFLNSIVVLLLLFMVSNLQAGTVTDEDRLDYYDINSGNSLELHDPISNLPYGNRMGYVRLVYSRADPLLAPTS